MNTRLTSTSSIILHLLLFLQTGPTSTWTSDHDGQQHRLRLLLFLQNSPASIRTSDQDSQDGSSPPLQQRRETPEALQPASRNIVRTRILPNLQASRLTSDRDDQGIRSQPRRSGPKMFRSLATACACSLRKCTETRLALHGETATLETSCMMHRVKLTERMVPPGRVSRAPATSSHD